MQSSLEKISDTLSISISKQVEDYLFVNQLITASELLKIQSRGLKPQNLVQQSYQTILDLMEVKHTKLYELTKKKLGIEKAVFDKVINSGDMFEWSVEAVLHAAQKHDEEVIMEVNSD